MSLLKLVLKGIFFFFIFSILFFIFLFSPQSLSSEKIRIVVPPDGKQEVVLNELKTKNLIRSEKLFNFLASLIKYPGNIEPGAYMLDRNMNLLTVTRILMFYPYQKWIILVPGLRREQVAERLSKKFNWDRVKTGEFLAFAKEGELSPDTYLLDVEYSGKDFAKRLMSNFNEKFDNEIQKDLLSQNVKNDTAIKIASIIERESGGDDDKKLIAGIIWNRLTKGMKLDIDATIQYALGTSSDWWPRVKTSDLKIDSPYNTYLRKGLPPGPICSPSLSSIKAAAYPQDTECLYYLHDAFKQIHCSPTYEGHLENIKKYLN